ncbi:hypothetical protein [Hymenobacter perfusus]|uniref:Uncharacterized protein n=1 Tax=Hymenobacter perfusus TaxID=1236770 RepID=A0A428KAS8_9BACT|nr:hypothetical protein [Hymenobacter perfusus]RSK43576.1 hypothetical protein EI293_11865 [Hymenobacter perfusus]
MMEIEINKRLALLEELETSGNLIRLGLGELQNLGSGNYFYFLPFQLLSQGFERFMKSYICIAYYNKNGILPDFNYLKKFSHDLEKILDEIKSQYYHKFERPQFEQDRMFIENDNDLKSLIYIISEFGKLSRYYNFDVITSSNKIGLNAVEAWQDFEHKLIISNNDRLLKISDFELNHEVQHEINSHVVIVFEKFVSGLSRQFIFGNLGEFGKQFISNTLHDFGLIYDNNLGKTDYRKSTTKYKETPKRVHKRTLADEIDRKFNPNYKSKKVTRAEYQGEWPFYVDEVIIECRHNHWCIVTIDGHDYSLSGNAKGRYKLENPHDAGMAILGKSFHNFITMAREL